MSTFLLRVEEVAKLITKGNLLILAGEEELLTLLPSGNWIAGTIPYFMDTDGGVKSKDKIFVTDITPFAKSFKIQNYNTQDVSRLSSNYFENGFSYIIIPSFSEIHTYYSENCYNFQNLFKQPLIGWISGFDLDDKKKTKGNVINGQNKKISDTNAVILHVDLIDNYTLELDTINLFEPGNGDIIKFSQKGFKISTCLINDHEMSLAKYVKENDLDTSLPLVTYFKENKVNVSFKEVNLTEDYVEFYAPVFPGSEYQLASPIGIYEMEFDEILHKRSIEPFLSCNCILNFLYASLEGKKTGEIAGPITFGEISHVLLNQTMVYLEIKKRK